MDAMKEEILHKQQYGYWTLWCRRFGYRSYRNVYAVFIARDGDACHQEAHKVYGTLANGARFHGFLIRSQVRKHCYAALSDAFSWGLKSKERRGGHWVIVQAAGPDEALTHNDVCAVRDDVMQDGASNSFCGVYFISNGNGAVKIGQTSSSLTQRVGTLQGGSPYPLRVVALVHTTSQKKLEAELHREHKDRRLAGEWFAMSDAEAVAIAESKGGMPANITPHRSNAMPKCRA